jgi:hypothetical protein
MLSLKTVQSVSTRSDRDLSEKGELERNCSPSYCLVPPIYDFPEISAPASHLLGS